jgi:hypothetical protein
MQSLQVIFSFETPPAKSLPHRAVRGGAGKLPLSLRKEDMPKHIQRSNFGLAQSLRAASSFVTAVFPRMTFAMKPRIFVGCAKQINDLPDEFKNAKAKLTTDSPRKTQHLRVVGGECVLFPHNLTPLRQ